MTQQSRIDEAKAKAAASLAAELKRIEKDDALRNIAPDYDAVKSTGHSAYCNTDLIRYEAKSSQEVADIIAAWRNKYGAFLPIGKYRRSCVTLTAFPWGEYANQDALEAIENDAVEARNSKGRGFSSVEFTFYQRVDGRQIEVSIDMAFRTYIAGFTGYINADYDNYGNVKTVQKVAPTAHNSASYRVSYGGGALDSADWRAVFNHDAFINSLGVK